MVYTCNKIFNCRAKVLYDKPADEFHPITLTKKNEFLQKLAEKYNVSESYSIISKRSGFIVSSTSWTEDEDFSILINALKGNVLVCTCFICDYFSLVIFLQVLMMKIILCYFL